MEDRSLSGAEWLVMYQDAYIQVLTGLGRVTWLIDSNTTMAFSLACVCECCIQLYSVYYQLFSVTSVWSLVRIVVVILVIVDYLLDKNWSVCLQGWEIAQIEQADPNKWWQTFVDNMSPVIKRLVAFSRKLPGISYCLFVCLVILFSVICSTS